MLMLMLQCCPVFLLLINVTSEKCVRGTGGGGVGGHFLSFLMNCIIYGLENVISRHWCNGCCGPSRWPHLRWCPGRT